ncbi:MAG TPA: hypothetical protein QF753_23060 [Victivallales bacterium]|nr:hypothetical protein [Victivallales bacterium]
MINTGTNSSFPDQVVPDEVKQSYDYGLQVARAIEGEWFHGYNSGSRFSVNYNNFHFRRLYARGEQPVQKYKDELSINGDLSYLNLDWKPIPVLSKFVDIVVNGMGSRNYDIKAFSQDPVSRKNRTDYADSILRNIALKDYHKSVKNNLGYDISQVENAETAPQSEEELEVHMQLDYKQAIEIAEEEAINNTLARNKYKLIQHRFNHDLTTIGIGANKTGYNKSEGVTVEYVDPANIVYSYTEDPNFEDIWYVGEIKALTLGEIKKYWPHLLPEELEKIEKYNGNNNYTRGWAGRNEGNTIYVLFFEYKTYSDQVFKIKYTDQGLEKALEKTDMFNPPPSDNFDKVSRSIEVLYSGAKVLGYDQLLDWRLAENMTRPKSNLTKVNMNYNITAPRMYKGRIESIVSKCMGFADMIQITHIKLQQVLSKIVPDGVFLDVDGLAEVDLGNGTNYNPAEALNMYFQTGSVVGRSMTQDGDLNHGKVPIQELSSSNGQAKIQSLISTYQYYLQMIRDVTGLNEARDGSMPNEKSLVGLQKLAAANSNTATRHILDASLYLTLRACENITLRISDCLEFDLTREALINSITAYNVGTLEEMYNLHLYDFGIYLELEPDDEEKALLEQNIQMALQQNQIYLEDAIDVRNVKNLKLANKLLKIKRQEKQKIDQQIAQQQMQAQAQAQAEAAQATALAEAQKQQAIAQTTLQIEQGKSQFDIQLLQQEGQIKMQLAEQKFGYDMQLAQLDSQTRLQVDSEKENRKDNRTKIQASQQSELIDQRKNNLLPKNFEITPETVDQKMEQDASLQPPPENI